MGRWDGMNIFGALAGLGRFGRMFHGFEWRPLPDGASFSLLLGILILLIYCYLSTTYY